MSRLEPLKSTRDYQKALSDSKVFTMDGERGEFFLRPVVGVQGLSQYELGRVKPSFDIVPATTVFIEDRNILIIAEGSAGTVKSKSKFFVEIKFV